MHARMADFRKDNACYSALTGRVISHRLSVHRALPCALIQCTFSAFKTVDFNFFLSKYSRSETLWLHLHYQLCNNCHDVFATDDADEFAVFVGDRNPAKISIDQAFTNIHQGGIHVE